MNESSPRFPDVLAATAVAALLLVGCTPEIDEDVDADSFGLPSDTGEETGIDDEDATDGGDESDADAELENDTSGGDAADPEDGGQSGDREITDFTYRRINQESCRAGCEKGASVNFTTQRVEDVEDGTHWEITDQELQTLRQDFLGEETKNKMLEGWECGDTDVYMGGRYEFEATIGTGANSIIETRVVTGCIPDDSEQADADRVQAIRDELIRLRNKYDPS